MGEGISKSVQKEFPNTRDPGEVRSILGSPTYCAIVVAGKNRGRKDRTKDPKLKKLDKGLRSGGKR